MRNHFRGFVASLVNASKNWECFAKKLQLDKYVKNERSWACGAAILWIYLKSMPFIIHHVIILCTQ